MEDIRKSIRREEFNGIYKGGGMMEEFPIKNRENAQKCYVKYWRCEDYSCPLFFHCSAGMVHEITDHEVKLLFEREEGRK